MTHMENFILNTNNSLRGRDAWDEGKLDTDFIIIIIIYIEASKPLQLCPKKCDL